MANILLPWYCIQSLHMLTIRATNLTTDPFASLGVSLFFVGNDTHIDSK